MVPTVTITMPRQPTTLPSYSPFIQVLGKEAVEVEHQQSSGDFLIPLLPH